MGFTPNGSTVSATIEQHKRQHKAPREKPVPSGLVEVRDLDRGLGRCASMGGTSLFAGRRSYDAQASLA